MAWYEIGRIFRSESPSERLLRGGVRADVAAAAGRMAGDRRSDPTVIAVAQQLTPDETVQRLVEGRFGRHMGLLVLTSARVFFTGHSFLGGPLFTVDLDRITRVEGGGSPRTGTSVTISTPDGDILVDRALALSGRQFADEMNEVLRGGVAAAARDPLEVLAELRALRDRGELSDAEFQAQGRKVIDEL